MFSSKKNQYHPYYIGKRSARMSFLAGIGTCLMLFAAVACVAVAVLLMLDIPLVQGRTPQTYHPVVPVFAAEYTDVSYAYAHTPYLETEAEAAPASWIQIVPPRVPDAPPGWRSESPEVFSSLPFYISDNADLYIAFASERPDLDAETVVWKVNASVHVPFYSQIMINHQPNPLFITPAYRLPPGFAPHELVPVNNDDCFLRATPETVDAFRQLRASAQSYGLDLSVTSAFRTAARQAELWEARGRADGVIARPYHSEHQTGRALDLWGPGGLLDSRGPSPTGIWVAENAHYHGFIIRYRAETTHITGYIHEPWHITYVGLAISTYMHENDILSLEEFVGRNPGAEM